jgi:allantoate deiminase
LASVIREQGLPLHRMVSGAGHDAAVMASLAPMTMLFLRSPGGVSHHPDERVWPQDVRAALGVMIRFLARLAQAEH